MPNSQTANGGAASSYLKSLRLIGRDARLCLAAWALVGFAAFGGIFTVLANLYLLRLGFGPEGIGAINAAGEIGYAASALPAGALGRRWGSRRLMIAGLALGAAGLALIPAAEMLPPSAQTAWLMASFALQGCGICLFWVNSRPFLTLATGPVERDHAFSASVAIMLFSGFLGSMVSGFLPGAFGTLLGVSLDSPSPFRYPLWIAAFCLGIGALAMASSAQAPREASSLDDPAPAAGSALGGSSVLTLIVLLALVSLLRPASEVVARTFFNVYLDAGLHVSTELIGVLSAAGQLVAVPAALASPLVMARWGHVRTYAFGALGAAIFLLPLALVPHWAVAGLGFAGVMGLTSLAVPAGSVFSMLVVPSSRQPAMSAAVELSEGLIFASLALAGGYLIAGLGYSSLFLTGAALSVVGSLLFWVYFRVPRGELARVGQAVDARAKASGESLLFPDL